MSIVVGMLAAEGKGGSLSKPGEYFKDLISFIVLGFSSQLVYASECVAIHRLSSVELKQYVSFESEKIEIINAFKGEYDLESEKCKAIISNSKRFLGKAPQSYLSITAYQPLKPPGKGLCLFDIYSDEISIENKLVKLSPTKSCSLKSETCTLKNIADLDLCLAFDLDFPRKYILLVTNNLEKARMIIEEESGVPGERLYLPQVSEYIEKTERSFLYRFVVAGDPSTAFSSEGIVPPQFVKINMLGEVEYVEENDAL